MSVLPVALSIKGMSHPDLMVRFGYVRNIPPEKFLSYVPVLERKMDQPVVFYNDYILYAMEKGKTFE